MTSLADLFNPSFFIILGIVTLFVALVVVYFESKMREQNHKIASMLSLVSTLAEDVTSVKIGLNHLAVVQSPLQEHISNLNPTTNSNPIETTKSFHLIDVSEDEYSTDDDELEMQEIESEDELELEEELNESELDELELEEELNESELDDEIEELEDDFEEDNVKVIKLTILEEVNEDKEEVKEQEVKEQEVKEQEEVKEDKEQGKEEDVKYLDESTENELKTISINLGEEHIDFKKLGLPKLRNIAIEKGLIPSADAQKLKKHELLKLLGVE